MRILVVEDDKLACAALRIALEQEGCEVVTAHAALDGLAVVKLQAFDAVVTDIRLPQHDGIWLWRQTLAARPEMAGRFIFISGYTFPPKLDEDSEREQFLPKPFTMKQLWTAITTITHMRR